MQIYVGTYGKYNNGDLEGAWLDPEDYTDKDAFLEACQELHGEGEHEFMFQDHEDIPDKYISESHIDGDLWDEFIPLDDDDREVCQLYWDNIDDSATPDRVQEMFRGKYDSLEDYARQLVEDCYDLKSMGHLANYIDYEAFGRDLAYDLSTFKHNGDVYVFNEY